MEYFHYISAFNSFDKSMKGAKNKFEQKIEELREEWAQSKNYPRKKKKRTRKRILVDYSLYSWCLEGIEYNWM